MTKSRPVESIEEEAEVAVAFVLAVMKLKKEKRSNALSA